MLNRVPLRLWSILFWAALVFAFVMAVLPHPPEVPGNPSDKAQHILAFVVLSVLGSFAFPRAGLIRVGIWLSAFGAFIEIVQAIPVLYRDCDVMDWLADTGAILVAMTLMSLVRKRIAGRA
jgi:VanZ family protein